MSQKPNPSSPKRKSGNHHRGETRNYLRFPLAARIEHWLFMASFTILAITGLVQKYAEAGLSKSIMRIFGGVENVRVIHHIAATLMMVMVVYHLGILSYKFFVRRVRPTMLPGISDILIAIQSVGYNLGFVKAKPQQGRYTFEEKIEYWAVVWGTVIMAVTGFMMWNPISTARFLPGEFIPAAKAAHGGEALLAVLSIVLWHLYHVIVRHFNKSMFTGYLTEEEMLEEHPLELADIKAGIAERPVSKAALARRTRVFLPSYGAFAVALLVGIYFFVSYEHTAISTIPPAENVKVYAPFTPTPLPTPLPTATPAPITGVSWESGIAAMFQSKCGNCHSASTKLSGLDLSTYQSALAGGSSGAAVSPGDPDASQIVIVQSTGNHPGQLSGEELALIREWISLGAPEK